MKNDIFIYIRLYAYTKTSKRMDVFLQALGSVIFNAYLCSQQIVKMMKEKDVSPLYQRDVLEFVTVAVQFCAYLEEAEQKQPQDFIETMLRLLPLLYLKGTLLPDFEMDEETELQDFVTEDNYNIVRGNVALLMGENDDFLDVFMEDMKYSDTPILTTVSENLADIYQDLKNFALNYRQEALAEVKENFAHYWGQRCVNVMRALHDIRYEAKETDDEEY